MSEVQHLAVVIADIDPQAVAPEQRDIDRAEMRALRQQPTRVTDTKASEAFPVATGCRQRLDSVPLLARTLP